MSVTVDFVHLCDKAMLDMDGKLALIGIFDLVVTQGSAPFVIPPHFIVGQVSAALHDGPVQHLKVELVHDDGPSFFTVEGDLQLKLGIDRRLHANHITQVAGLQLPMAGTYTYRIHCGTAPIASAGLRLHELRP